MVKPVPGVMTILSSLTENDTEDYRKMIYYRSTFCLVAFSKNQDLILEVVLFFVMRLSFFKFFTNSADIQCKSKPST